MARYLVWLLGGGTLLAAGAVAVWIARDVPVGPEAPVATVPPSLTPPAPETPVVAEAPVVEPAPVAPAFDVVRVARDGEALVAGSAAPGAAVTLRVDGAAVAEAAADAAGQFVAMFSLEASDSVQVMTLEMADAAGQRVAAEDQVILTPRPVELAALQPQAAPPVQAAPATEALSAAPPPEPVAEEAPAEAGAASADVDIATVVNDRVESAGSLDASAPSGGADAVPVAEAPEPAAAVDGQPTGIALEATASADNDPAPVLPALAAPGAAVVAEAAPADNAESDALAATVPSATAEAEMPTAFLLRGDGQVEVLGRAPSVLDNVIIDTISYSDAGDVQIAGRAARANPDANLLIYLNNRPIALGQAEGGDWRMDLPSIDPGVYTLRVDQLGSEGRVVSRFETPFQREAPEVVAAARARVAAETAVAAPPVAISNATDPVEQAAPEGRIAQIDGPSAPGNPPETGAGAGPVADDVAPPADPETVGTAAPEPVQQASVAAAPRQTGTATGAAEGNAGAATATVPSLSAEPEGTGLASVGSASGAAGAERPEAFVALPAAEPALQTASTEGVAARAETGQGAVSVSAAPPASVPAVSAVSEPGTATAPATPRVALITVQPGNTLWHISRQRYGAGERYVVIYNANRSQIRDPDLIYPGQVFTLPAE